VLGGSPEISCRFASPGSFGNKTLVQEFLAASPTSTSPIEYGLKSTWDLMAERISSADRDVQLQSMFNELLIRDFFIAESSLQSALPPGSYTGSCSAIAFDHMTGMLTADCGFPDAAVTSEAEPRGVPLDGGRGPLGHSRSSLGYYLCSPKAEVHNINGILKCSSYNSKPALPGGGWIAQGCSPETWSNGVLTAWCAKDGGVKRSVYNMKDCPRNELYLRYTGLLE